MSALLALSLSAVAVAAPTKPTVAKVDVSPKARAVFARAVELYRKVNGLSVIWNSNEDGERRRDSLDFNRVGKLRLANNRAFESLIVIDGKIKWGLDDSKSNEKKAVYYNRQIVDAGDLETDPIFVLQSSLGLASPIGDFLDKTSFLDPNRIERELAVSKLLQLRAALLRAQPFNGQPCDLVRVTQVYIEPYDPRHFLVTEQDTYWFARDNGRLMRLQERRLERGREAHAADFQITEQKFNPQFAPNTFKFTPPKGAVLKAD